MRRISVSPRPDWQATVESQGLSIHTLDGRTYWDESVCYLFTGQEIQILESCTSTLYSLCVEAADFVIENELWEFFSIPKSFGPWIKDSWDRDQPSLYGRFDLLWDGSSPPKLLEFNADTPTSLVESAVIQWFWLEDRIKQGLAEGWDQFNSIHEKLIESWAEIAATHREPRLHLAAMTDQPEDMMTAVYMLDVARQAGLDSSLIDMSTIGYDSARRQYVDLRNLPIDMIFKLYPWEWMLREEFGRSLALTKTLWIEPPWKMILSNKAILPLLWELFPDHPNLLWSGWEPPDHSIGTYVSKPIFGREGSNVEIRTQSGKILAESEGPYDPDQGPLSKRIYQEFLAVDSFQGKLPMLGAWVVGGEPAGLGIREDDGLITGNFSRFVPHAIAP